MYRGRLGYFKVLSLCFELSLTYVGFRFKAQVTVVEEPSVQAALKGLESNPDIDCILLSSFSDTATIFNAKVHCPLKDWTADDTRQFVQTF